MKNYFYFLLLSLTSLFASAATVPNVSDHEEARRVNKSIEQTQYIFYAEAFNDEVNLKHSYQTASEEDFNSAKMDFWAEQLAEMNASVEDCTVTISLKVRIGFGSNFVEASASVDGVPCDEVVEALVRLKEQLNAALK